MGDAGDAGLRRREFLERTAYAAGLAGMSMLPVNTLLAEAAKAAAATSGLPSNPDNSGLEHIVVVMMENRSFDHYFGWLQNADAIQHQTFTDPAGSEVSTRHFRALPGEADHQGCGFRDPGHGWDSGRVQLQDGFMAEGSGNDIFALTYFDEGDLGFIQDAGKAYTVYDRFFCSLLTSTWPNRYYEWSAQSGGIKGNDPPVATLGHHWETIFDRIAKRPSLRARYYNSDLPFSAVWGVRGLTWTLPLPAFYLDCALGTLPNVSFVDPPFRDGGGFDGNSADEHPHGDVRLGQAWMADVVNAFVQSPCYRKGALFVVYDEWGGFFDHVAPPSVPDNLQSTDLAEDFGQMGFRIPAVCVSPWTRNQGSVPRVDHDIYGFESILKLISWRWGLGTLEFSPGVPNLRHESARNIGSSFDWSVDASRAEAPDLPDPTHIVSRPCTLGGGNLLPEDAAAHESDLADLADLADHLGFHVGDGKPQDLFQRPDSVRRAFRPADRV